MNNNKVLLVEDEVDLASSLSKKLQCAGYVVEIATTSEQAIGILEDEDFVCALLDIELKCNERYGGIKIADWIRQNDRDIPFFYITVKPNNFRKIEDTRPYTFITKPISRDGNEVISAIQEAIAEQANVKQPDEQDEIYFASSVFIKNAAKGNWQKVYWHQIMYITGENDYKRFVLNDSSSFKSRLKNKDIDNKPLPNYFHPNFKVWTYMFSTHYIEKYDDKISKIIMKDGESISYDSKVFKGVPNKLDRKTN